MRRRFIMMAVLLIFAARGATAQTSLEQCQADAEQNYPLIKRYDLISQTADVTVANISKGWLPQIQAYAQVTLQNKVAGWPDAMSSLFEQMGIEMEGMKKTQYKVGLDATQNIYDGGAMKSQKNIARAEADMQKADADVSLYAIRKQINELYFSTLLLDEKIRLNDEFMSLLRDNEKKLESLRKGGLASANDVRSVRAERLAANQQRTELLSQRETVVTLLGIFVGHDVDSVAMPASEEIDAEALNDRPELAYIDSQIRLAEAQEDGLDSNIRPHFYLFGSVYFGYPGYNMFDDIMDSDPSFNALIGAKLTWNIGGLYTRKNDKEKLSLQRSMAENSREVFLFQNDMEKKQQNETIASYARLLEDDNEIVDLRTEIRKTTESSLDNGIVDTNELTQQLYNENSAKMQRSTHRIEMLKEIYDLKYTINSK